MCLVACSEVLVALKADEDGGSIGFDTYCPGYVPVRRIDVPTAVACGFDGVDGIDVSAESPGCKRGHTDWLQVRLLRD